MDAHPPQHPSATSPAFTVPDLSVLRALPDADALQALDAYLWGAAQISSILRERLLHDSKESTPSTSSFHRPGPHPDVLGAINDRRGIKSATARPRSPALPFAVNTMQERILLPPPRSLASPLSKWPGSNSAEHNSQSAPSSSSSSSTSAGMKHYTYDIAPGSGASSDAPNHSNDRLTIPAAATNSTTYAGAGYSGNNGSSLPVDERYNNNNSSGDASLAPRLQKAARHSPSNSEPNADELLLATAYGPDYDTAHAHAAAQHRGAGPSSASGSVSSEYPPPHRLPDENCASSNASVPASSPTVSYTHQHRSRANTISSILDDSATTPPGRRGGATLQQQQMQQTHVVDQHLMDLREDLQASRRDRQQFLPSQHQYDSSRYGQSRMSPPGGMHHGQQQMRPRSRSPSRSGEFVHRQEYDEARYTGAATPTRSVQPPQQPISSGPPAVAQPPQPNAQLAPQMGPQHQQHQQQQQQQALAGAESNIPALGRKVTPALTVNALGQRTCQQCHQPGRYKDGRCIEKWGPGPAGPGTVCDRCRKRMKRVERRNNHEANLFRQTAAQTQLALTDPQQRQYTATQQLMMQQAQPQSPPGGVQVQQLQAQQHQRPMLSMTIPSAQHHEQHPGSLQLPPQQQHRHGHLSQMRRPSISTPSTTGHPHHFSPHERDRFERERELEASGRMVIDCDDDDRGAEDSHGRDDPRGLGTDDREDEEEDELVNDDYPYAKRFAPAVPPVHHHHLHSHHHHPHTHSQILPPTSSSRSSLPESQERFEQHPLPPYATRHRSNTDSYPHRQNMYDPHRRSHRCDSRSRSRSPTPSRSHSRSRSRSPGAPMMRGRSPRSLSPAALTRPRSRSRSRSRSPSRSHPHSTSPLPMSGPSSASDTLTPAGTSPSSVQTEGTLIDRERPVGQQRNKTGSSLSSPTTSVLGKRRSPPTLQDREQRERGQGNDIGEETTVMMARRGSLLATSVQTSSPGRSRETLPPPSSLSRRQDLSGDFVMVEK